MVGDAPLHYEGRAVSETSFYLAAVLPSLHLASSANPVLFSILSLWLCLPLTAPNTIYLALVQKLKYPFIKNETQTK